MNGERLTTRLRIKIARRRGLIITKIRSAPRFSKTEYARLWLSCVRRNRRFSFARRVQSPQEEARRRARRIARRTRSVCPRCGHLDDLFAVYTARRERVCWSCRHGG